MLQKVMLELDIPEHILHHIRPYTVVHMVVIRSREFSQDCISSDHSQETLPQHLPVIFLVRTEQHIQAPTVIRSQMIMWVVFHEHFKATLQQATQQATQDYTMSFPVLTRARIRKHLLHLQVHTRDSRVAIV